MKPKKGECGYCGRVRKVTREHVFPKNLYPDSRAESKVQRLTISSCLNCNNGWSDDEAHFRSMVALSGPISSTVRELWDGPILRGFLEVDGSRRVDDVVTQLVPTSIDEQSRHLIYPGNDPRVVRILKKIVRGLCYHHGLGRPRDNDILADVFKPELHSHFFSRGMKANLQFEERDAEVVHYVYSKADYYEGHSVWLMTFYDRTTFFSAVHKRVGEP